MSMLDRKNQVGAAIVALLVSYFSSSFIASAQTQTTTENKSSMKWSTQGEETPSLGRPASADDIAVFDIDVEPDGSGLPPGSGTSGQGAVIYKQKCESCHGENGVSGKLAPRLAGGFGTIGKGDKVKPVKTVGSFWPYATSLYAYMRRAMPYEQPKSLTADELYSLSAYILQLNGLIRETDVMNAQTLPAVQMPNRDGFFRWKRGD